MMQARKPPEESLLRLSEAALPKSLLLFALSAAFFAGCQSKPLYSSTYGTKVYTSQEEALDEHAKTFAEVLTTIRPTKTPVHGRAIVVLASNEATVQALRQQSPKMDEKYLAFWLKSRDQVAKLMADAIEKRRIFDTVSVIRSQNPSVEPIGDADFLVYFDRPDPVNKPADGKVALSAFGSFGPSQVRVRGRDWPKARGTTRLVPFSLSTGEVVDWLDALEIAAKTPGG